MEINNQEALFLSFAFRVLEEVHQNQPELDPGDIAIPVKEIRKQGFREDHLQRVVLALETKGLVAPEYNYHDELKRVRLLPEARRALDGHGGLKLAMAGETGPSGGTGETLNYLSALYASIRTLKKSGHKESAAHMRQLLDALLDEDARLSRALLEHLDALAAEASAPQGHRRDTVVATLVDRLNTLIPPRPGILAQWSEVKKVLSQV